MLIADSTGKSAVTRGSVIEKYASSFLETLGLLHNKDYTFSFLNFGQQEVILSCVQFGSA